ncbi:hypothetical protein HK101_004447, partial [Irineochytrium annulatum]
MGPLPELLIDGFDLEQVWEQMQLQNGPMLTWLAREVRGVLDKGDLVMIDEEDDDELGEDDEEMMMGE